MKILITGSTGFVGQHLCQFLKSAGHQISVLTKTELQQSKFEKVTDTDIVIHLAGKAHDLSGTDTAEQYVQVNYELTKNLYDAFLQSQAGLFIYFSSIKALCDFSDLPAKETDMPNPKTPYGVSKRRAEEYIERQELSGGKRYIILRPSMIHGPGNKGNLNLLYKLATSSLPYPLGAFKNSRSFLGIDNLCAVIDRLSQDQSVSSGVYHIADDTPLSTVALVDLIAQTRGKKVSVLSISPVVLRMLARVGDILHLPINSHRLDKLTENLVVDNNKILQALGMRLPFSTEQSLVKTFRSFDEKPAG